MFGVVFPYPKNYRYIVTFQANPSGGLDDGCDRAERQTDGLQNGSLFIFLFLCTSFDNYDFIYIFIVFHEAVLNYCQSGKT